MGNEWGKLTTDAQEALQRHGIDADEFVQLIEQRSPLEDLAKHFAEAQRDLDPEVFIEALQGTFCGTTEVEDAEGGMRILSWGAPTRRWTSTALTFAIGTTPTTYVDSSGVTQTMSITGAQFRSEILDALNAWTVACPYLTFTEVTGAADITFGWGPIDGSNNVLASCSRSNPPVITFDQSEAWTINPQQGTGTFPAGLSLGRVLVHELGHAIGLQHSDERDSIMYPFNGNTATTIDVSTRRQMWRTYGMPEQDDLHPGRTTNRIAMASSSKEVVLDLRGGRESALCSVWKGQGDDQGLWWSEYRTNQGWTPQQVIPGQGTSQGPALASYSTRRLLGAALGGTRLYLAWKGVEGDEQIYQAVRGYGEPGWTMLPGPIPGRATSTGVSVTQFGDDLHMAWKGIAGDEGIYWSTGSIDGTWNQQVRIPGVGTSAVPTLAVLGDTLWMFWKGTTGNAAIWYSRLGADNTWAPQQQVQANGRVIATSGAVTYERSGVGTTGESIAAAPYGKGLFLSWRGVDDQALWFTVFDGREFNGQMTIPGVGSKTGPTAFRYGGRLHLLWRGVDDDAEIWQLRF